MPAAARHSTASTEQALPPVAALRPEADGSSPCPEHLSIEQVRAQMQQVVLGKRPAGLAMPTGVPMLDLALAGGIPRGRITEVVGMRGAGKTALLREVVRRVLAGGSWVAWVDARRTLAPEPWAALGSRLVMIRPRDAKRGAWCADLLLRSGVFALVVLDGAPLLSRVNGVRLAQLARERDAALVVIADGAQPSRVGGAVRLQVTPLVKPLVNPLVTAPASRRRSATASASASAAVPGPTPGFLVTVEKGGVFRSVEVNSAVVVARRMCTDPEVPDRRGVARGTRHTWTPHSHANDTTNDTTNGAPPVTWGGLGASVDNVRSADASAGRPTSHPTNRHSEGGHTARPGISHTSTTGHAGNPAHGGPARRDADGRDADRRDADRRDADRRTRDWANVKGRRRAAESGYGRRSRRELANEKLGERAGQNAALGRTAAGIG